MALLGTAVEDGSGVCAPSWRPRAGIWHQTAHHSRLRPARPATPAAFHPTVPLPHVLLSPIRPSMKGDSSKSMPVLSVWTARVKAWEVPLSTSVESMGGSSSTRRRPVGRGSRRGFSLLVACGSPPPGSTVRGGRSVSYCRERRSKTTPQRQQPLAQPPPPPRAFCSPGGGAAPICL